MPATLAEDILRVTSAAQLAEAHADLLAQRESRGGERRREEECVEEFAVAWGCAVKWCQAGAA